MLRWVSNVVDSQNDQTSSYESFLEEPSTFDTHISNRHATGVTTLDGSRVWTADGSGRVYVYDDGVYTGRWHVSESVSPSGIAVNGADIWVVDDELDAVFHFAGGVSLAQGNQLETTRFELDSRNEAPSGIASAPPGKKSF